MSQHARYRRPGGLGWLVLILGLLVLLACLAMLPGAVAELGRWLRAG